MGGRGPGRLRSGGGYGGGVAAGGGGGMSKRGGALCSQEGWEVPVGRGGGQAED